MTETEDQPACTAWVGPEDRCGEPSVAADLDSGEPRCAACVSEQRDLWDPYGHRPTPLRYEPVKI